jgi:ribosomal protein L7/L12
MRTIFFCCLILASTVGAQSVQKEKRTECRLPRYQPQAPALSDLNLEEAEKREIVQLVQEGRKIDAVLIMRKCRDLTLKEQKMIVDAIQKSF